MERIFIGNITFNTGKANVGVQTYTQDMGLWTSSGRDGQPVDQYVDTEGQNE